jgi:prepilin-type N-terminal cleavage/methylation domain-containing protein
MKSASIGIPAALRSIRRDAGFTLIEALVAMTVLLTFVTVLGPYMFHARRIADNLDGRVAAQALLRSLLDGPIDRSALAKGPREGETGGISWSIAAEPMFIDAMQASDDQPLAELSNFKDADPKDADAKDASANDANSKDASSKDPSPGDANPQDATPKDAAPKDAAAKRPRWIPFRLVAQVSWQAGLTLTAETVRLGLGE